MTSHLGPAHPGGAIHSRVYTHIDHLSFDFNSGIGRADQGLNSTQLLSRQVCCDPDSSAIIACTDYPGGRMGPLWNGQSACLSYRNGGYPNTAAGVLPALDRLCTVVAQRKTNANLSNPPACPLPLAPCTRPPPTAPCCPGSVRVPPPCLYRDRQSSLSNLCPHYMHRAQSFRHSCHSPHCPPCADFLR